MLCSLYTLESPHFSRQMMSANPHLQPFLNQFLCYVLCHPLTLSCSCRAVAFTHSHWQITLLMEFNYLSLPHGDFCQEKTNSAGVCGGTAQGGGGWGGASFPLVDLEGGSLQFWFGEMSFCGRRSQSEGWGEEGRGRECKWIHVNLLHNKQKLVFVTVQRNSLL